MSAGVGVGVGVDSKTVACGDNLPESAGIDRLAELVGRGKRLRVLEPKHGGQDTRRIARFVYRRFELGLRLILVSVQEGLSIGSSSGGTSAASRYVRLGMIYLRYLCFEDSSVLVELHEKWPNIARELLTNEIKYR